MVTVKIEIGPGEFFDRFTISALKLENMPSDQSDIVRVQFAAFEALRIKHFPPEPVLDQLAAELEATNRKLWDLETEVRTFKHPLMPAEMDAYLAVTQAIFTLNEDRADLKRRIDQLFQSGSAEAKIYGSTKDQIP